MADWQFYGRTQLMSELNRIITAERWLFCRIGGRRRVGNASLLTHRRLATRTDTSVKN